MNALQHIEAKIFDKRFPWAEIDIQKAKETPHILESLHEACLIESYFSSYMGKMLELFSYDLKATAMFTIEAFEAYTHYYCLRKYLDIIGYNPVADEEVIALRRKDENNKIDNEIQELVNFGMTEFFADYFFNDLSKQTEEKVLVQMLQKFSHEEKIHAEFAFELLQDRAIDDKTKEKILQYAHNFTHVGNYVLTQVSKVNSDNVTIIQHFNKRLEQLLGESLSNFISRS